MKCVLAVGLDPTIEYSRLYALINLSTTKRQLSIQKVRKLKRAGAISRNEIQKQENIGAATVVAVVVWTIRKAEDQSKA